MSFFAFVATLVTVAVLGWIVWPDDEPPVPIP